MLNKKQFKSQKELLAYVVTNKASIISLKQISTKFADAESSFTFAKHLEKQNDADKAIKVLYENDLDKGVLKRTIVANTYLWMDNHDDVHAPGIFAKSIRERGKNAPLLHDHNHSVTAKIGKPLSINETETSWKSLGIAKSGNTTILKYDAEIVKDLNEKVFNMYKADEIDQHSVGMRYINIELAVNDEDYKEEYKIWKAWIDKLGNPETAEANGYFFLVKEAALLELSAVLFGSNELTPTMQPESKSTAIDLPEFPQIDANALVEYYKSITQPKTK